MLSDKNTVLVVIDVQEKLSKVIHNNHNNSSLPFVIMWMH
jgi:hypothetical protein